MTEDIRSPSAETILTGPPKRIYFICFGDAFALGIYLTLVPVFFGRAIALGDIRTGAVLAVAGATSIVGALPIGRLANRVGNRDALRVLFVLRALSFLGLAAVGDFIGAMVAAGLSGLLNRGVNPVIQSVGLGSGHRGGEPDSTEVRTLARLQSLRNAGIGAGAIPASVVLSLEVSAFRWVFVLAAVSVTICGILSWGLPRGKPRGQPVPQLAALRDPKFASITVIYAFLSIPSLLLQVGLPLWIVQRTHAPSWSVGLIQVVNTILVVLLQIAASRGSERYARARSLVAVGALLAAVATALIPALAWPAAATGAVAVLLAVVLLFTISEIATTSGTMAVALTRMPRDGNVTHLATFSLGFGVATVAGPPIATIAVAAGTPGWLLMATGFLVVSVLSTRLRPAARTAGQPGREQ
ncbi:MFS transporter [Amycolatopsis sp. lyj-23]|uniref:MFS transporter n=1 Tax=Amycolatopsis sp. lyj-23 TaxID=2789283 RepID=UPI00397E31B2